MRQSTFLAVVLVLFTILTFVTGMYDKNILSIDTFFIVWSIVSVGISIVKTMERKEA